MNQAGKLCRDVGIGSGFYSDLADDTEALQIWPEHRYYADNTSYAPSDKFDHFTIEQALVDHVELVLHLQNTLNMSHNPVIAIGASYSKFTAHEFLLLSDHHLKALKAMSCHVRVIAAMANFACRRDCFAMHALDMRAIALPIVCMSLKRSAYSGSTAHWHPYSMMTDNSTIASSME